MLLARLTKVHKMTHQNYTCSTQAATRSYMQRLGTSKDNWSR